jgi:hypothetical protein
MSSPTIPSPMLLKESTTPPPSVAAGGDVPMTAGQRIYKTATYLSVDWVWNGICGAAFSDFAKYNDKGIKYWGNPTQKGFDWTFEHLFNVKDGAQRASSVKNTCTFTNIIIGGMMTLPPLLVLENQRVKRGAVEWIDRRIYGDDAVEHDAMFHNAYEAMANEPKKDFKIGMVARFAALAPLLASVVLEPTKTDLKNNYFTPIAKGTEGVAHAIGFSPESFVGHMPSSMQDNPITRQERWNYLHNDSLAMDWGFGLPYAAMHSFWYDRFAAWMAPHKEPSINASEKPPSPKTPTTHIRTGASVIAEKIASPSLTTLRP